MITIQSAESALKNVYLDTVINDINTKTNPFLTMVQKNKRQVNDKDIKVGIRYGDSGSVGAGSETGDLPNGGTGTRLDINVPLKNLYGTFQITDKAVKAAQTSAGAFSSLLSSEMSNLIASAQNNVAQMIYGNGLKFLSYVDTANIDTSSKTMVVPARFLQNFVVGVKFAAYTANNERKTAADLTISAVNASTNTITYTGTVSSTALNKYDRFYLCALIDTEISMNGVDSVFMGNKLYGQDVSSVPAVKAFLKSDVAEDALKILNEDEIMAFFDEYEERVGGNPADIILTHPTVRKALFENLRGTRTNIEGAELAGGFKGFSFNGVPLYADVKCKGGTLYALDSDSFAMHELTDWTWLEGDDGSILKQMSGKPTYQATLVKYADFICDKPFLQGKATNYSATQYVPAPAV
ncbi:MAG: phage major capsid protein [Christensenellaceae bacterium]|jgi:hypothetical protein|nr:phage major capsid protein [Christensenellaceae bacterium]